MGYGDPILSFVPQVYLSVVGCENCSNSASGGYEVVSTENSFSSLWGCLSQLFPTEA